MTHRSRTQRTARTSVSIGALLLMVVAFLAIASSPADAITQPGTITDGQWNASFNGTWPPDVGGTGWPGVASDANTLPADCGIDVGVIVDRSGSIVSNNNDEAYINGLESLINALDGTDASLGIWSFGTRASDSDTSTYPTHAIVPVTGNAASLLGTVGDLETRFNSAGNTNQLTNWEEGLNAPLAMGSSTPDIYLVLTDGAPTARLGETSGGSTGSVRNDYMAGGIASANALKASGARVLAVGVGSGISEAGIKLISGATAFNGSNIGTANYLTSSFAALTTAMQSLATEFCGIDLGVTKTDGKTTTAAGATNDYTIAYSNSGNTTATGATLTETIPANTTFVAASSTPGWSCVASTCTLALADLAPGASGVAHFVVHVNSPLPAGTTQVVNTVSISTTTAIDPNAANDTATDTDTVSDHPAFTLTKTLAAASPTTTGPNGTVNYTITYTNTSNIGAAGVVLHETVPANTTFNAAGSPGWSCGGVVAGSTCTYNVGAVAGGGSGSVPFSVKVKAAVPSGTVLIHNDASITYTGCTVGCGEDDEDTPLDATPDLAVTKDDGGVSVELGDEVTYTITYSNVGAQDATGVVLTETVPEGSTFVGPDTWTCVDSTCTYAVGNVAAGASGSVDFTVKVDTTLPADQTQLDNVVTVHDDGTNGTDPNPGNNTDTDDTPVKLLEVTVFEPVCDGDVPYLDYAADVTNVPGATVTLTWINPDGDDVVMADLPLEGRVLWPGAVVDEDGNPLDWPGWTQNPDGTWTEGDAFDWVRPSVSVLFQVNPEQTLEVAYPPATPTCDANPEVLTSSTTTPETVLGEVVTPQSLPKTGSNVDGLFKLAGLMLILGGVTVMAADAAKKRRSA